MKQKNIYFYTNLFAWSLVFLLAGNYAFGVWNTPSVPPPNGNLPAPINVSSTAQSKEGYLAIGTSTAPTIPLDVTGTANMTTLSIGGTAVTATAAELNFIDGVTSAIQTQLNTKEPTINAGTTAQYLRGDKTWQTLPDGTDTWITTQTCSTDYALQSVGKTTKTCINKVDYSDVAYDVSCTNCLTATEVASADIAYDVSCTNCLTNTEVASADYASDADKVDGISSGSFLRSDANDNLTAAIIVPTGNRDEGIFGTYVSTKTQHIWSMGTAYRNAADGSSFGNLYGLAYKYNGSAGGHGVYLINNGTAYSGLGTGLWTSGAITGATINTGYGAKEIGDSVGNCAATDVHKGDGGCEAESSLSVATAATASDVSCTNCLTSTEVASADLAYNLSCTGCVGEAEIAQNTLDDSEIQDNSLTASSLAANSVGDSELIASPAFTNPTAATPTSASHVATKAYVDAAAGGGGPEYKGLTGSSYTGDLGSFGGANAKCNSAFPGSHICTVTEFVKTGVTSNPAEDCWMVHDTATIGYDYDLGTGGCDGYGEDSYLVDGLAWSAYYGEFKIRNCGMEYKICCCE